MPTDTITPTLVINKLTKSQYEGIVNPSDTELYLVPDDDLREHRSYYTTGTATVDGETVDVDIMYEGVAPEGSVETDAVWTITTIVATKDGNVLSNDVDTDQTWDFPTPTPVVPVIGTTPPILYPTTASDIKTTSMVVKSSVDGNGKILTENGFVYNTSGNPTVSDTKVVCDLGVGWMEKKLENLTMNTQYYIRSYGENASGLSYGSESLYRTTIIPDIYQLVEYLKTTGTQYIDTDYIIKSSDRVCIKSYNYFIFGARVGTANSAFNCLYSGSNRFRLDYGTIQWDSGLSYQSGSLCEMDWNANVVNLTYGNNNISHTFTTQSFTSYSCYIFGFNGAGNVSTIRDGMQVVNFKIYDNTNTLVRNMYPVYRISDNKPGMYDIVNGVFYTNQGTGEFIVGPDKEWDE